MAAHEYHEAGELAEDQTIPAAEPAPQAAALPDDDSDSPAAREKRREEAMTLNKAITEKQKAETKAREAEARANKLADENLKLQDKIKASVLTDKDKREITLAVKTTKTEIMDPVHYEQLRILSRDMFGSNQVPKTYESEAQVFAAMRMGVEMGLSPSQAVLQGYFIGGRYEIWGSATGTVLRKRGWRWTFEEADDTCTIKMRHINERGEVDEEIEDSYSYEEAELSGFTTQTSKYNGNTEDKLGWKPGINRKRKLRYGVLDLVLNTYLPDIAGPLTGVSEYAEDYDSAAAAEEARNNQPADKAAKRQNISAAMANYKPRELEEVKPRAIETQPADQPTDEAA